MPTIHFSGSTLTKSYDAEDLRPGVAVMLSFATLTRLPVSKRFGYRAVERERFKAMLRARRAAGPADEGTGKRASGHVASHFLDSGAFTLRPAAAAYAKAQGLGRWAYYDTPEFYSYLDDYAAFVKKFRRGIDLYANVDVIPNAELSWRNQQYLEAKGLRPVPVVHYRTDLKWLRHYMDRGHRLVGLGGLVGSQAAPDCRRWLDRAFGIACGGPGGLPTVRLHGFGVTAFDLLVRYPWWSVDSTTWVMVEANGSVLVPPRRGSEFRFDRRPLVVRVTQGPKANTTGRGHYLSMPPAARAVVRAWLDEVGVPLGRNGPGGEPAEHGVINRNAERRAVNLHYFERLRAALPPWPWPFRAARRPGLGVW